MHHEECVRTALKIPLVTEWNWHEINLSSQWRFSISSALSSQTSRSESVKIVIICEINMKGYFFRIMELLFKIKQAK